VRLAKRKSEAELLKKLTEAVSKAVEKTLEKWESQPHLLRVYRASTHLSKGSNSPFKGERQAFRRRMLNAKIWEPVSQILIDERLDQLILAEFKRQDRIAADMAQIPLPGFEGLPKRMHVERLTVGALLMREARYEKRAVKNKVVGEELHRLADAVRDQPPELSVPEALARVSGVKKAAREK
jgi:hypothetical protein